MPGQALKVPESWGSQISRQSAHESGKVISPKHRSPLHPRKYYWYSFLLETESIQGHCVAGRIMSMKNSNEIIGNRTLDLPTSRAVPQPTAPPIWEMKPAWNILNQNSGSLLSGLAKIINQTFVVTTEKRTDSSQMKHPSIAPLPWQR
jgi:hypothetical protein